MEFDQIVRGWNLSTSGKIIQNTYYNIQTLTNSNNSIKNKCKSFFNLMLPLGGGGAVAIHVKPNPNIKPRDSLVFKHTISGSCRRYLRLRSISFYVGLFVLMCLCWLIYYFMLWVPNFSRYFIFPQFLERFLFWLWDFNKGNQSAIDSTLDWLIESLIKSINVASTFTNFLFK